MKLAAAVDVLSSAGIQEQPGSVAMAGLALDATLPRVESYLETSLQEAEWVDYFSDTSPAGLFPGRPATTLRLANAFLSSEVAVVIRKSADGLPLVSSTQGDVVDPASYVVNRTAGTIALLSPMPAGMHALTVAYTAGYPKSGDQLKVPEWLKQAGVSYAISYLHSNPANIAKDKTAFARHSSATAITSALAVLQRYARPRENVVWPSVTEKVE